MWAESTHRLRTAALLLALACAGHLACATADRGRAAAPGGETATGPRPTAAPADLIDGVTVAPWSFDPSAGDTVEVAYTLAEPARVTVSIYGPNEELIARPVDGEQRTAGPHREPWDGLDATGAPVADEAYYPVIVARGAAGTDRHDPLATSGGERVNPRDIHFKSREGLVTYVLPEPSRVLVRAGLEEGPLLATLVNWEPRGPGLSTERWSGRDQQGLRSFSRRPDAVVIVQAYALPDGSFIAYGNRETPYRQRYSEWGAQRPTKPPAERAAWLDDLASPHWHQPAHLDKDPAIAVHFPRHEDGPPLDPAATVTLEGDEALVRVTVPDEATLAYLREQRFELVAFVDDERIDEAEQGHLPFNWSWDLSTLGAGEHWLTINLVTFRQLVGTTTRRVEVIPAPSPTPEGGMSEAGTSGAGDRGESP